MITPLNNMDQLHNNQHHAAGNYSSRGQQQQQQQQHTQQPQYPINQFAGQTRAPGIQSLPMQGTGFDPRIAQWTLQKGEERRWKDVEPVKKLVSEVDLQQKLMFRQNDRISVQHRLEELSSNARNLVYKLLNDENASLYRYNPYIQWKIVSIVPHYQKQHVTLIGPRQEVLRRIEVILQTEIRPNLPNIRAQTNAPMDQFSAYAQGHQPDIMSQEQHMRTQGFNQGHQNHQGHQGQQGQQGHQGHQGHQGQQSHHGQNNMQRNTQMPGFESESNRHPGQGSTRIPDNIPPPPPPPAMNAQQNGGTRSAQKPEMMPERIPPHPAHANQMNQRDQQSHQNAHAGAGQRLPGSGLHQASRRDSMPNGRMENIHPETLRQQKAKPKQFPGKFPSESDDSDDDSDSSGDSNINDDDEFGRGRSHPDIQVVNNRHQGNSRPPSRGNNLKSSRDNTGFSTSRSSLNHPSMTKQRSSSVKSRSSKHSSGSLPAQVPQQIHINVHNTPPERERERGREGYENDHDRNNKFMMPNNTHHASQRRNHNRKEKIILTQGLQKSPSSSSLDSNGETIFTDDYTNVSSAYSDPDINPSTSKRHSRHQSDFDFKIPSHARHSRGSLHGSGHSSDDSLNGPHRSHTADDYPPQTRHRISTQIHNNAHILSQEDPHTFSDPQMYNPRRQPIRRHTDSNPFNTKHYPSQRGGNNDLYTTEISQPQSQIQFSTPRHLTASAVNTDDLMFQEVAEVAAKKAVEHMARTQQKVHQNQLHQQAQIHQQQQKQHPGMPRRSNTMMSERMGGARMFDVTDEWDEDEEWGGHGHGHGQTQAQMRQRVMTGGGGGGRRGSMMSGQSGVFVDGEEFRGRRYNY